MQGRDEPGAHFDQSEGGREQYWRGGELRGKGLPGPIIALCGAILIGGLGWTLFETLETAPADMLTAESTVEASEATSAIDATSNIAVDQSELEAAAASLETVASEPVPAEIPVAEPVVAVVTCRVQSMAVDAWRCVYPANQHDSGGYLKVSGGGDVTRYGPTELMGVLSGSAARVELGSDYSIEVQANGNSDYTLRLEIRRGGTVIYQNEGSGYDTLRASG